MPIMLLKMRKGRPITPLKEVVFAESLDNLFGNLTEYLGRIPEEDRYNWFYTVNSIDDTKELKSRTLLTGQHIAFDIDKMAADSYKDYIPLIAKAIGHAPTDFTIIMSGNGLHFLAKQEHAIENPKFFKANRLAYKAICDRINGAMAGAGLPGHADTAVFDSARILRLPGTTNIKEGKDHKDCFLISHTDKIANIKFPEVVISDVAPSEQKVPRNPDAKWVQDNCEWLKHCMQEQGSIPEPEWFSALATVSRLGKDESESRTWAHKISCEHPGYNPGETNDKFNHVLEQEIAPSKAHIEGFWDGCKDCAHYDSCISPALLRGPSYIGTRKTGFRIPKKNKDGLIIGLGPIVFDDVIKFFALKHNTNKLLGDGDSLYYRDESGLKFKRAEKNYLKHFVKTWVKDSMDKDRIEFVKAISLENYQSDLKLNTPGLINLQNGVFDLAKMELRERTDKDYFTYCAEYSYDKDAECPEFMKFISEIMLDREDLVKVLIEVISYAVSGCKAEAEKAFVFKGSGANGKSVLLNLVSYLVTEEAVSYVPLEKFGDMTELKHLRNSLVNLSPEFPKRKALEDATFKKVVSGETIQVRSRYADSVAFEPNTKLIVSTNNQIKTEDLSDGVKRRLMIIPFDLYVKEDNRDTKLFHKLKKEAAGILNLIIPVIKSLEANQFKFSKSVHLEKELEFFIESNDPIRQWLSDSCLAITGASTGTNELEDSYLEWCKRNSVKFSSWHFKRDLKIRVKSGDLPAEFKAVCPDRSSRKTCYKNIQLLSERDISERVGDNYD